MRRASGETTVQQTASPPMAATQAPQRCRLALPALDKGLTHLRRQVLAFRRMVEDAYLAVHGKIGIAAAARIATACVAIRQAARCERVLARTKEPGEQGGLDHATWLAYSDRLVKYREAADKALASLGLETVARPLDP